MRLQRQEQRPRILYKLEPGWARPFIFEKGGAYRKSDWLKDMVSGEIRGKCSTNGTIFYRYECGNPK